MVIGVFEAASRSGEPGFVSGQWLLGPGHDQGMGVVVFATKDAAFAAAQGPRSYPRDDNRAWNIEDVAVYTAGHLRLTAPPSGPLLGTRYPGGCRRQGWSTRSSRFRRCQ